MASYAKEMSRGIVLPQFLSRAAPADVPEDIDDDIMDHLNDPNWDLRSTKSAAFSDRSSVSSFELPEKKKKTMSIGGSSVDYSQSERTSVVDTESQLDTTTRGAASHSQLRDIDYNDDSAYPEVRAAVSNIDDPRMPVNTFRMWTLGLFYAIVISGLNQFFSMRYPSVLITGLVAQLTAMPLGKFLEWALPRHRFNIFGYTCSFNPGPFNIKEHACITVMANVVYLGAYSTDVSATQRVFYGQNWGIGYQLLLALSSQLIGYSYAGLVRQFLVWPASMIWPGALVNAALFNTLHKNFGKRERKHWPRERFFLVVMACSFVWFWFPAYIWTGLSVFNWACWAAPQNPVVNQLFGTMTGLGMGVVTFDWSMISYIGSPLVTPWWAEANTFVSFVFFFWIVTPILYYKNVWFSMFMPIVSSDTYDNTGASYDVTRVMVNGTFDQQAYQKYSPLYLSTTFALSYGLSFAAFTSMVVHIFLWYRRDIMRQLRGRNEKDVHTRLMSVYPEVPWYWYGGLFLVPFVFGVIAIERWSTELPMWGYILALVFALIMLVPVGIITAITNQQVSLAIISELIVGYVLPNRPVAMMIFKTYGFIVPSQAVGFLGDLKLGHYMKVPPRMMFLCQTVATIVSCFVVVGVQSWMFANIPDMCSPDQANGFTCPSTSTFASASIVWGAIGPARLFSPGALYSPLCWFFLIGAVSPIPFYFLARKYPHALWRYINTPVFWNGVGFMPPATGINYASWFAVGAVFQFFVRRFHFRWWMRYNYILSAGLDAGVAFSIIIIFYSVMFPGGGFPLNWWGNTVWQNTLDAVGAVSRTVTEDQPTFGLTSWK